MGVIEAIKRGFGISSKNLRLVLVLFIFNLVFSLASIPFVNLNQTTVQPGITVTAILVAIIFIIISVFIQGGSLGLVRDYIKEGKMALVNFSKYGLKYYPRLLALGLLIMLIVGIIALVATIIILATASLNNMTVTIAAGIVATVIGGIGIYYILLLVMSPYLIVCEDLGVIESLKRSIRVVRRSILKVILLLLSLILISVAAGATIGFLTGILAAVVSVGLGQVLVAFINSAYNSYMGVVMMASFIVFYFALVEKEKSSAQKVF